MLTLTTWLAGGAIWLWLIRRHDRFDPEPWGMLLKVGLVGGLVSGMAAAFLNDWFDSSMGVGEEGFFEALAAGTIGGEQIAWIALFVGVNEEGMKALAALLFTRRFGNLDEPVDALLYAMVVALGFAFFENLLYVDEFGGEVLITRYLTAVPLHVSLAMVWGCGLARARFVRPNSPVLWVMAPSLLLAALLHAGYDYLLFIDYEYAMVINLVGLVVLLWYANLRLKGMALESPHAPAGQCLRCGHQNRPLANFCGGCGEPLTQELFKVCPGCERRIPGHELFCPHCGAVELR